jgi:ribonuclease P protein component
MGETNIPTKQPQASQKPRIPPPDVNPGRARHHQGQETERAGPAVGLIWRVERRDTFLALGRARRVRAGPLTVSWVPGDPAEPPRVAYAIGRRVGSAVERNRLRRRLRMLIRTMAADLPPGAYLIGTAPEAARLSSNELRNTLMQALHQAANR